MKIPRYWARHATAGSTSFSCWGWSDESAAAAGEQARQRAIALEQRLKQGKAPDRYLYGDRPMREETLEAWSRADGTAHAAITRNAYGCQVLNTADIMFVDVDLPDPASGNTLLQGMKKLFGKSGPDPRAQQEAAALAKVDAMVRADARGGVRTYRTRGGLRYLFTHLHADPKSESTRTIMTALGADPLYMRLCQVQECFRARLSPKPWRCAIPALSVSYPWLDREAEARAQAWLLEYAAASQPFATCRLLGHLGTTAMDAEIARVVTTHDTATRATSSLPLA